MCIAEIREWMKQNFLKLNDTKTEFLILGSRYNLPLDDQVLLTIGNDKIKPTLKARNIGAIFDIHMNLHNHVTNIIRSCNSHIRDISKIRKYLSEDSTKRLVQAYVISRLDNLNSLLAGICQTEIDRLQVVHNNAARVVARLRSSDHISHVRFQYHWLPVKYRIIYKVLILIFKALRGDAPIYICDLVKSYSPSRSLRSSGQLQLSVPEIRTKSYGERALSHYGPTQWNILPYDI